MELRTLLILLCWSAFITGSLSKKTKHGFKSALHDNMKGYFKSYTVGNFKGVQEKQFDRLKISKWLREDVSKRAQSLTQDQLNNEKTSVPQVLANFKNEETERPLLAAKREQELAQEWLNNEKQVPTPRVLANVKSEETERPLLAAKREQLLAQEWLNNEKQVTLPQVLANFKYEETERPLLAAKREVVSVQEWLNNEKQVTVPQVLANFKYEETERPLLAAKREDVLPQEWLNNEKQVTVPQVLANFKYEETERPLLAAKREVVSVQEWLNNEKQVTVPQVLANFKYEETERPLLAAKREDVLPQEWLNNEKQVTVPQVLANFKYEETERPLLAAKREVVSVQEWLNNEKPVTVPHVLANFKYEGTDRPLLAAKREVVSVQEWLNNEKPVTVPHVLANFKYEGTDRPLLAAKREVVLPHRPLVGSSVGKIENPNDILAWFHKASDLRKKVSDDIDSYFNSWSDVLNILPGSCGELSKVPMPTHASLIGLTPVFMNLFWPFRFDVNIMNQRLAAYGLTNQIITGNETLKEEFFKEIQDLQGTPLPVKGNQIMFSFGEEDVIDGLNRLNIVPDSKSYTKAGKHLFTKDERERIVMLANSALDLINTTHTELYSAIVQMVSSIAFFKDESDMFTSGTVQSAVGLIWLDPRKDWTVPLMAEQIVHEFIHTTLFYAELVHGGYKDRSRLPEALVVSAIRQEPRIYDRSLHAAYVSTGLITFHTRAGFLDRAAKLAETLPEAVQELNRVNAETDVLDEAGRAMLDFLTNYVCLTRM